MKHLNKVFAVKLTALLLVFLLVHGELMVFPQDERLDKLFQWAKMDYNSGKYRDVVGDLELILSYYDKGSNGDKDSAGKKLKGKIHLLLGAADEKLGRIREARENYQLAKSLLEKQDLELEDVFLGDLDEYRRIALDNQTDSPGGSNIIERPINPHKKKRRLLPYIIGGVLVAGLITTVLLLNKNRPKEIEVKENYDTQDMGIEWMYIMADEYLMGDNFDEGEADEKPVHPVYLDGFYISKYEITFAQFDKYIVDSGRTGDRPTDDGWGRGQRPVINITWRNAYDFCEWLSRKTGRIIHLPSEAQWEVAARGMGEPRFPWGNTPADCTKANYNCFGQTQPVGSHPEGISAFGVHDMAGNVSEWCRDLYSADFYQRGDYRNPYNEPPNTSYQWVRLVIRGGSWTSEDTCTIRSADRSYGSYYWGVVTYQSNNTSNNHLGFRIVKE